MNVSSSKNEFEKNGWMFFGFFWKDCDFKPIPKSKMKISEITHFFCCLHGPYLKALKN